MKFFPPSSFEKACEALRSALEEKETAENALAAEKAARAADATTWENRHFTTCAELNKSIARGDELNAKVLVLLQVEQNLNAQIGNLNGGIINLEGARQAENARRDEHARVLEQAVADAVDGAKRDRQRALDVAAAHEKLIADLAETRRQLAGVQEQRDTLERTQLTLRHEHEEQIVRLGKAILAHDERATKAESAAKAIDEPTRRE